MMKRFLYKLFPGFFTIVEEKVLEQKEGCCQVVWVADSESNDLIEDLGITKERRDYLADRSIEAIKKHDKVLGSLEELSKECKHPNELVYISFNMCKASQMPNGSLGGLIMGAIIDGIRKGGQDTPPEE